MWTDTGPLYGEQGLAREHTAVWLYDEPLAQNRVRYRPDRAHLLVVEKPKLFETTYQSAQLPMWDLGDGEWLKLLPPPPPTRVALFSGAD
jgi:hypothetical protein